MVLLVLTIYGAMGYFDREEGGKEGREGGGESDSHSLFSRSVIVIVEREMHRRFVSMALVINGNDSAFSLWKNRREEGEERRREGRGGGGCVVKDLERRGRMTVSQRGKGKGKQYNGNLLLSLSIPLVVHSLISTMYSTPIIPPPVPSLSPSHGDSNE